MSNQTTPQDTPPLMTAEEMAQVQRDWALAQSQQSQPALGDPLDESTTVPGVARPVAIFAKLPQGIGLEPRPIGFAVDAQLPENWFETLLSGSGWMACDLATSLRDANQNEPCAKARQLNKELACKAMMEATTLAAINRRFLELTSARRRVDV